MNVKDNLRNRKISLTASLVSSLEKLSCDLSPHDEVLVKELMNGSEFFRRKGFPLIGGFKFPTNFHDPLPPVCFQSLYDFSARTQLTILALANFPPCKLKTWTSVKK